jgi:hypothetical protein
MSTRTARWILWISFVLMVPVPILLFGPGLVPAARLLMLGGIGLAVALFESSRGAVGMLTGILLAQGLFYAGLLWLAAYVSSRGLARLSAKNVTRITLAVVAASLLITLAFEVYRGPFRAQSYRANLLQIYE